MQKIFFKFLTSQYFDFVGDLWSYNRETKQFIVSPEPDVAAYDLSERNMCVVLGSDGLTNVLKPQQIIDIVMHYESSRDKVNIYFPNINCTGNNAF